MKRIHLLLAVLALPATVVAQGQVIFANTSTTLFMTADRSGANQQLMSGVNAFRIGLYIAPPGTSDPSLFTLTGVATNSSVVPGRFSHPESPYTIAGNNGTPIAFQIRAWVAASGATYESARYRGWSAIGSVTPAVGGAPAPNLFGSGPGQLATGIVIFVPEPSTWALVALGILIIFYCRKKARGKSEVIS